MNIYIRVLIPAAVLWLFVACQVVYGQTPTPRTAIPATVVRVVDGDTYVVALDDDDEIVTVRLLLVDTPETVKPRTPVQCYGPEASARAHELLDGQQVRLVRDSRGGPLDRYGRTLAYVELADGTDVGLVLVSEGYARALWRGYSQRDRRAVLRGAEAVAQRERRGLWGVCEHIG